MNVALIAPRFPPAADGVGDHAAFMARAMSALGARVTVFTDTPDAEWPVPVRFVGARWSAGAVLRVVTALAREPYDGIVLEYTPLIYGGRSFAAVAIALFARLRGRPVTTVLHEGFARGGGRGLRSRALSILNAVRDRAIAAFSGVLFVASDERLARIRAACPGVRGTFAVVPIGANVEPAGFPFPRTSAEPGRIVSFGVVMSRRRLERAVAALAGLRARGVEASLDIVGRVYDRTYASSIEALARDLGVGDRVTFSGTLSPHEISRRLERAAFAIHAPAEGTISSSGSLLALLAHGVPVIAPATADDESRFAGAVIHCADDPVALCDTAQALIEGRRDGEAVARVGRALYEQAFSWERIAQVTLARFARGTGMVHVARI